MYNLMVTAESDVWERSRYSLDLSRVGEYTPESFRERFSKFDDKAIKTLTSIPTIFAYETACDLPARVGKLTKIFRPSGSHVRFEFSTQSRVKPLTPTTVLDLAWELDIGDWEMNRTHWAVKDVDLARVLREAELVAPRATAVASSERPTLAEVTVAPTVFSVPSGTRDDDLVALMMPFDGKYDGVHRAIQGACKRADLRCLRTDDIWEDSTIIQDIFNLIFRSRIVIAELTGLNGNVLYETGIAHTLGRPVVPISQDEGRLPFDLAHHRKLVYQSTPEGLRQMSARLERKLRSLVA